MHERANDRRGERGSAMVIAVLVIVILTLLGISYLLMAETENRIAENEKLSMQALYFGEAAARQVKRWFDRPPTAATAGENLINPTTAVMDRTLRQIDTDGEGPTTPVAANGSATYPYYKQTSNLIFEKPYRGTNEDTLLGTEAGPDIRIDDGVSAQKTFLDSLSADLLQNFPMTGAGVKARVSRIDIYEPPYLNIGGSWTRYGMGTVKVIARVYKVAGGTEQVLAERQIKAVLNETPYPSPFGPLHSCNLLQTQGDFTVHWGATTAVNTANLVNNHKKIAGSIPRDVPVSQRLDQLMYWNNDAMFAAYKAQVEAGLPIEDPWFRFLGGQTVNITSSCTGATTNQQCPFTWDGVSALGDHQQPYHNGGTDSDHSNVFQNMPIVTCPDFDYDTWKAIATSGGSDVHYYTWDNGSSFKENGLGTALTFDVLTDNQTGLFFFDTQDGNPPTDTNGDGEFDNLTPAIRLSGGTYGVRGFVYLNAVNFQSKGVTGRTATYTFPGEPFQDKNQNGVWDSGENWINLNYNGLSALSSTIQGSSTDSFGGSVQYNKIGPTVTDTAVLWGVLYNSGRFAPTGNAQYLGSVIARSGIGDTAGPAAGTPNLYWDPTLLDNWPPSTWDLPRVVITRWVTDV